MIDPSEITLDVIEEWAKSNDPEETAGQAATSMYCPVTECVKEVVESDDVVRVGRIHLEVGGRLCEHVEGVRRLVGKIDGTHAIEEPVTFAEVLELIAEVREEG